VFQQLQRTALIALGDFAVGPRSPFVSGNCGGMLLIGIAFEAKRLLTLVGRHYAAVSIRAPGGRP